MGIRLATPAVVVLALAGCGGEPGRDAAISGWTTFHDRERGYSVRFPSDWSRSARALTPRLTQPRELVSLATFDAPPGGARCAHLPGAGLERLGPRDVLITLMERRGSGGRGFPARRRPVRLGPAAASARACAPRGRFTSHWLAFADRGRGFYALVAFGRAVPAQRRRHARQILDSLRFGPAR